MAYNEKPGMHEKPEMHEMQSKISEEFLNETKEETLYKLRRKSVAVQTRLVEPIMCSQMNEFEISYFSGLWALRGLDTMSVNPEFNAVTRELVNLLIEKLEKIKSQLKDKASVELSVECRHNPDSAWRKNLPHQKEDQS